MFAPPHRTFAANVANAVGHINNVKHAHGAKRKDKAWHKEQ